MAKKNKTKTDAPHRFARGNLKGGVFVTLPRAVRTNCDVMRWLYHWVVDALADYGHVPWMADDVEQRLADLDAHIMGTSVAELVRQAIAAANKLEEPPPPRKATKGKGKGKSK